MPSLLNENRPPVFCPGCTHKRITQALDQAFQKRRQAINAMSSELKDQIGSIPPQDYTAAKEFLKSVMYAVTGSSLS